MAAIKLYCAVLEEFYIKYWEKIIVLPNLVLKIYYFYWLLISSKIEKATMHVSFGQGTLSIDINN
jgi:hypothetical protein